MNRKQQIVLAIGLCLFTLAGLVPPWRLVRARSHGGYYSARVGKGETVTLRYGWLFAPPHFSRREYVHASQPELQAYTRAKQLLAKAGGGVPRSDESIYDNVVYHVEVERYQPGSRMSRKQAGFVVREFEERHGAIGGPLHGNWWWVTSPWSEVEPRLDVARLLAECALIVLATVWLVVLFNRRTPQPNPLPQGEREC